MPTSTRINWGGWSLGLLLLIGLTAPAWSAVYTLQWDPVNDNRVANYTVYYGDRHHAYDKSIDAGTSTTIRIPDLDINTVYYFSIKSTDSNGVESRFSKEITSGLFRYVFGLGEDPGGLHELEVLNMNQLPEQSVSTSWLEYNELNGETRVATGDIDGDGQDEVVLGFAPAGQSGIPGGRFEILDSDFSHLAWGQVDWDDYNAGNGETRPAIGDIDGDGKAEIFIGLGRGGGGVVESFRFVDGRVSAIGWNDAEWPAYGQANGETWPALGDIDGDGKNELVIGLGNSGGGIFLVKKGFDMARVEAGLDPWRDEIQGRLSWTEYAAQLGETRPAVGDLNGDGRQEIVLGLGQGGGGSLEIFDYTSNSLLSMASAAVNWPDYDAFNGETRPAIGDIDGDQRGEIIVGLGTGSYGRIELFADALSQFSDSGSLQAGTAAYQVTNGALWPAIKREIVAAGSRGFIFQLYVLKVGTGYGRVDGGGDFATGTTVTPTAVAAVGSTFAGWSPSTCGSPFALTADTTCTATFTLNRYNLTVTKSGTGIGTVDGGGTYGYNKIGRAHV